MSRVYPLLLLQTLLFVLARTQILAIDYGTQFIKASLVHVGAGKTFSIVENPKSQRKFINSVKLVLFRSDFTIRNAFMRLILCPNDQEDQAIASSIPIY
jgi:hypothetical protein